MQYVYQELHAVAFHKLAKAHHETLSATALVNEVYLRLFGREDAPQWENRRHFFWAAGRAMRDILVERARAAMALKRGGGQRVQQLTSEVAHVGQEPEELVAIGSAVDELAKEHPRAAEVVMLRFFAGLEYDQVAQALDISSATARRDWTFARAWLHQWLTEHATE